MLAIALANKLARIACMPVKEWRKIKPVIQAFINQRTSDRIGMVVFSGRAYTLAPLTFDHEWLGYLRWEWWFRRSRPHPRSRCSHR
mgnify:CR=1 FL=1